MARKNKKPVSYDRLTDRWDEWAKRPSAPTAQPAPPRAINPRVSSPNALSPRTQTSPMAQSPLFSGGASYGGSGYGGLNAANPQSNRGGTGIMAGLARLFSRERADDDDYMSDVLGRGFSNSDSPQVPVRKASTPTNTASPKPARRSDRRGVLDRYDRIPMPEDTSIPAFSYGKAPSLEDFIAQAQSLFSEAGTGIENRQAALNANRTTALGSMDAATAALAAKLAESRGQLDSRYAKGITEADAATDEAQAAIQAAHASSLAQNNELYSNLGIQVDESRNAEDQAYSVGSVGEIGAARDAMLRSNQLTAYELGTRNTDAANMRGVENRGAYERDFQGALAQLLDEQQNIQRQIQSAGMDMYGQAMSQYNQDRGMAWDQYRYENDAAREDARMMLELEMGGNEEQEELAPQDALLEQLMGYGVTPRKAQQWLGRLYGNLDTIQTDPGEFGNLFGNASTPAQAALYNYLLQTGAVGKG